MENRPMNEITRRGALGCLVGLGAGAVLIAALPSTVMAAPVRATPTQRELAVQAAEYVEREIGAMIAIHDADPVFSRDDDDGRRAWLGMWSLFFGSVGRAKADAIAEHGPAAEAAWDELLDGMLGAMRDELAKIEARDVHRDA
jgi:hypothetical protein